jgi:transcriptional regulator GlxA family with amidase domain
MAGSGMAWHMLVLTLIARFASPDDAMHVARINLLDLRETSPLAYASLTRGARAADELVARCQLWAASNYQIESPVTQMVALSGLPERTFKRRFQVATGMSALEYIHTLRLEEAKQMLEAGDLPVEAIAQEVGYQDASFFGRLFKRKVALTPAQYRRRFGALGRHLRHAAGSD